MRLENKRYLKHLGIFSLLGGTALLLSGCSVNNFYEHASIPGRYLMSKVAPYIGGYGIAIIVFTIIVRLCLMPMMIKRIKHMTSKQILMKSVMSLPRVKSLQKQLQSSKTMGQKRKISNEIMAIYNHYGVGIAGSGFGCLTILIQIPIFAMLYDAIRFSPKVRASSLFGIKLGHPSAIFIIAAVALYGINSFFTYLINKSEQNDMNKKERENQKKFKKFQIGLLLFMPVSIGIISLSSPAALELYFCIGGLFVVAQQIYIHYSLPALKKEKHQEANKITKEDKQV